MSNFKKISIFIGSAAVATLLFILIVNFRIDSQSGPYIFSDLDKIPKTQAVLILGARVYNGGAMSSMLEDRAAVALELYKNGKADKILISGDHGKSDYDEVNTVKDYLLKLEVKGGDIFLDHAGFDTYDSLYRAKEIFKVSQVAVITQNFHLPRAVYIGRSLGLDVYGFSADRRLYAGIEYNEIREIFSKVKAFFDVNLHVKPRFLGEEIPISGDSKKSRDKIDAVPVEENKTENKLPETAAEKEKIEDKKPVPEEKNVLLEVPFTSQAPFGNWSDPRKQDGCEEAAAIMAMAWVKERGKLAPKDVDEEINAISSYEEEIYGNFHDTSAGDAAERIFKGYFKYGKAEVKYNIGAKDIKEELFRGNLVIVPTDGQKLGNPNYTPPGPSTHNLVIKGYDVLKKEFITNDPGTRRGEGYRYKENILEKALLDYPTGNHEPVTEIKTAMIAISK